MRQPLHGVVFRGVDKNNDGDIQDEGEVTIFFNGSGTDLPGGAAGTVKTPTWPEQNGNVSKLSDFITGMTVVDGAQHWGLPMGWVAGLEEFVEDPLF